MIVLIEKLKQFFSRNDFDFESNDICMRSFHSQLFVVLAINGIFFNNKKSKLRLIWPAFCTILSIVASVIQLNTVIHMVQERDTAGLTASFAYLVIIAVVPFLYYCIAKSTDKIYKLIDLMDNDFKDICALGDPYRSKFIRGQLRIWQCGFAWCIFVVLVAACYILLAVVALMYHCLFATLSDESARPLIFPIWVSYEIDPYASPLYEILFVCMVFFVTDFATTFAAYVYVIFHILLHCYYLIDMVITGLDGLFDGLEDIETNYNDISSELNVNSILKSRIKRIVDWHCKVFNLIADVIDGFGLVLGYQIIFSSVVLCLMAFYVSVQIEQGSFDFCICMLMVGALLQLWIPCYIGSQLRSKGFAVSDACFYSRWHTSQYLPLVRMELQMIIQRAQRPITMRITCLPVICLETFSSIMSTAYSYFNMMRQK